MLPAHIAQNIRRQILYYLQSTFSFRDKETDQAFQRFLEDPDSGLFKGPWVQLKRPFRPARADVELPFDLKVDRHPFLHQYRARTICTRSGWRGRIADDEDCESIWASIWANPELGELPMSRNELIKEYWMVIDDLDGGRVSIAGDHSAFKGPNPIIESCKSRLEEAEAIVAWAKISLS